MEGEPPLSPAHGVEAELFHDNRMKKHNYRLCSDEIRQRDNEIARLEEELAIMSVDNAVLRGKAFAGIMNRIFTAIESGKPPNGRTHASQDAE